VADLAAFVRSGTDNDLTDHPAWEKLVKANAHRLEPAEDATADLIAVHELLAEKPTEESINALAFTLSVVASIGSVCELPTVMRFFNGNPNLGLISGGIDQFTGRAGRKRWDIVGDIVARGWDGVISAVDEVITTSRGRTWRSPTNSRRCRPRSRGRNRRPVAGGRPQTRWCWAPTPTSGIRSVSTRCG
jgi:hypothetical protein